MTLRITLMWNLRETRCLTVKKWPWICLLLPSAEPNVPIVCLERELGRCPVVRGGRRELVQEEHCLSSWQPGEQQTALHTRPQATWGVYWRRLWLGTPAAGTPPHQAVDTAQSPRSAAPWRSWYCVHSTRVAPAPSELRAPSSAGGGRGEGGLPGFCSGVKLREFGV